MLFADVVGYSRITERQIEHFAPEFLGTVSQLIAQGPERPVLVHTWGDALYMVFDDVVDAGHFALRLRTHIQRKPWDEAKLPADLDVRMSLHTGPVLLCVDPVVRQMTFTGSHVSHAARIEPRVVPGEIWASEAFASQAAIAGMRTTLGFSLDYLGQLELAKDYGIYPLFRVRSRLPAEENS